MILLLGLEISNLSVEPNVAPFVDILWVLERLFTSLNSKSYSLEVRRPISLLFSL